MTIDAVNTTMLRYEGKHGSGVGMPLSAEKLSVIVVTLETSRALFAGALLESRNVVG